MDYINGPEAKDFILFKADLLLKEAGNDPIKRAGLIKEIVHSIARVPDPLKRSLFVKECSRLFEVDENLLINETNKTVSSQMKRRQQERELDRRREQRQADRQAPTETPPPDDGSFPTMEPGFPSEDPGYGYEEGFGMGEEPPVFIPEQKRKEGIVGDEFQEKDIVRLLISSGGEIFDKEENITVAEYLLHNIEDVIDEFDNQLYKLIAHECQEMLAKNKPITSQVFINHENPKIQVLSVNLMSSPYEFSENWGNRFEIFLNQKQPDANFIEESSKVLMHFRLRKITRICEKNRKKIKELSDSGQHEESVKYLHVQLKLDKIRTELAKSLGIVVVK